MDPLTALSVATSVVSFVDFGSKLLSKSRKLYKSSNGVLTEHVDLQLIALDISTLVQGLRRKLPEHRPLTKPSKGSATFEDDGALDEMCRRCVDIASELLVQLEKLKVDAPPAKKEKKSKREKGETEEKAGGGMATEDNAAENKAAGIQLPTSGPTVSKTQGEILGLPALTYGPVQS